MTRPSRRTILRSTCASALLGLAAQGCGPKRRPAHMPPGGLASPAPQGEPPAAAPLPPEPTEGRLIHGHHAALGLPGTRPQEPLAPPGRWVVAALWRGWVWWPDYVPAGPLAEIENEIAATLPRWEPDQQPLSGGPGPKPGTRVVLLPGPSFAADGLFAAGLYGPRAWSDGADVIWLGLTDAATRAAVPEGHPYRLYAPAAGHELAHQYHDPHGRHP